MTFEELTRALGVEDHAPLPEGYYPAPKEREAELCSLELIDRLHEKFALFGEYYEAVRQGFLDLENDPLRKAYLDSMSLYFKDSPLKLLRKVKYPLSVGTPASNMLPFLVHLPSVERTYEIYRERGFTHEEAMVSLKIFQIYIREEEHFRTRIVGVSRPISCWMSQFTKGEMFYLGCGGINFQPLCLSEKEPYVLRNKKTGALQPVFGVAFPVHKSGLPLGSAGAEEEEGSFLAEFEETETEYIGYPSDARRISLEKKAFSKEEWTLAAGPGDTVISTHIFWDADFSPETVEKAFSEGIAKAKACYPEYDFKALHCCSWLMSPEINDALGEKSKLSMFSARFTRYPKKSAGKLVFNYVFPGFSADSLEELPENTGLQRAFKKILLSGGQIYETSGLMLIADQFE